MSEFQPTAEFDAESDAIYVSLADAPVARSTQLDDARTVDLSSDGAVVGIEFLGVGGGVDIRDVPHKPTVERLIGELGLGLKIFA